MADDAAAARRRRKFQKLFDAAPEFVKRLNAFEDVQAGETVVFECQWKGLPKPATKWYRDDEEVTTEDDRVKIEHLESGLERLTVSKVRKKDEGAYKCKAENQEGVASTTGYLTVKGDYTDKPLSAQPRKTSEHTVSAPPHLRTIVEQKSMEEQEEEEYSSLPPSPLQDFIDAQLSLQQRLNPPFLLSPKSASTNPTSNENNPPSPPIPPKSEIILPGKNAPLKAIPIYFYGNTLHSSLKKKKGMSKLKQEVDWRKYHQVANGTNLEKDLERDGYDSGSDTSVDSQDFDRVPCVGAELFIREETPEAEDVPRSSSVPPELEKTDYAPPEKKIRSNVSTEPESSSNAKAEVRSAPIARQEVESFCLEPSVVEYPDFDLLDSKSISLTSLELEGISFGQIDMLQVPALDRAYCGRESPCGDDIFLPNGADSHGPEDHFDDDNEYATLSYQTLECKVEPLKRNVDLGVGKSCDNSETMIDKPIIAQTLQLEPKLKSRKELNLQSQSKTTTVVKTSMSNSPHVAKRDHVIPVDDQSSSPYMPYHAVKQPKPQFGYIATMNYFLGVFGEQFGLAADEYGRVDLDFPWLFLFALTSVAAFVASATEVSPLIFVLVIMFISVISFRIFFQNMYT